MYTGCPSTLVYCANFADPCKPAHKYVRCTDGSQIANCYKLETYCQLKPTAGECGRNATEVCGKIVLLSVIDLMHMCVCTVIIVL